MMSSNFKLDWRSSDTLIISQISALNSFAETKDVKSAVTLNEWIVLFYLDVVPAQPLKFKVFKPDYSNDLQLKFQNETIEDFLATNPQIQQTLSVDEGAVVVTYV